MIFDKAPYNVVLPNWMYKKAMDREQFMGLLNDYMKKCYPDLAVKSIKDHMAVCERRQGGMVMDG